MAASEKLPSDPLPSCQPVGDALLRACPFSLAPPLLTLGHAHLVLGSLLLSPPKASSGLQMGHG